ncbi:broad specificity phosphatase PhoE [Kribbella aluminosa]|uniref:Broad specificity phosphatase PhoE n=1 Tax=Kribbella aluminosa TaxID=416017 RepID=A0ABS4UR56_9ACTN|nr:histidine phosphatase family protein [Kribbella aluminosa]MBP2354124.1 broad specificity phosphatase PhoE [Kribbella aluminosa]
MILLVRHGEADGTQLDEEGWWGPARDFAPLSALGVQQAQEAGRRLRGCGAARIIASPMTRALQTAALIAAETQLPLTAVDVDLREWLPDNTLTWRSSQALAAIDDCAKHNGTWPPGESRAWEPHASVRRRALGALRRHATGAPFIAVCHSVVIETLTGTRGIEHCGVHPFDLTAADQPNDEVFLPR